MQVAPLPRRQAGHGHAANADALHAHDGQVHHAAHVQDLARLGALERKTQARFVLPADLHRRDFLAVERQAVIEQRQAARANVARHLNDEFLFDLAAFLKAAVSTRKTIVISGGTGSGKTTLLNALVKEIDRSERLVVIEDAPEVRLDHPNSVGLVAVRGDLGEAQVDADTLLAAALRLRPDRILLGELRGREAFAFLRAVNSGHPGSLTTVHADSPTGALDQIALLALTSGVDLGWDKVQTYVSRVIDVVVQLDRTGGARRVSEVLFRPRSAGGMVAKTAAI